jgi:signal transduction histidine kinase
VGLVVALVVAGSAAEAYPVHHYAGLHLRSHPAPAEFVVLAIPAVLLVWRRSHPVAVYLAAVASVVGWGASGEVYGAALVAVLVSFYALALARPGWLMVVALGMAGSFTIWLAGGLGGSWGWWGGPQLDLWAEMMAAGAAGMFVAARRHWKLSERLRAEQLERSRQEEIRQQVTAERVRIARELHDVVAHSMAMINVQAAAASTLVRADPEQVAASLQAIRRASKDGLRELRAILDVLRQVDEADPAVVLPDRNGLEALAQATRAAGVRLALSCEADLAAASPSTALAAYRIVQESLTNVIRHAGGSSAEVSVVERGSCIVVDVVDDGQGRDGAFVEGTGTGLVGMSERVRALGGHFEAGPAVRGGFRVHAELPLEPPAPADDSPLLVTPLGS